MQPLLSALRSGHWQNEEAQQALTSASREKLFRLELLFEGEHIVDRGRTNFLIRGTRGLCENRPCFVLSPFFTQHENAFSDLLTVFVAFRTLPDCFKRVNTL